MSERPFRGEIGHCRWASALRKDEHPSVRSPAHGSPFHLTLSPPQSSCVLGRCSGRCPGISNFLLLPREGQGLSHQVSGHEQHWLFVEIRGRTRELIFYLFFFFPPFPYLFPHFSYFSLLPPIHPCFSLSSLISPYFSLFPPVCSTPSCFPPISPVSPCFLVFFYATISLSLLFPAFLFLLFSPFFHFSLFFSGRSAEVLACCSIFQGSTMCASFGMAMGALHRLCQHEHIYVVGYSLGGREWPMWLFEWCVKVVWD